MIVFLKGEPTGVSLGELGCLWTMLGQNRGHPNWVSLFIEKCLHVQNSKSGKLSMGGMITLLAEKVEARIPNTCTPLPSRTSIYYDLEGLRITRFLM